MSNIFELKVADTAAGTRLDKFLAGGVPGLSRSRARTLVEGGQVLRGGRVETSPSSAVVADELVRVEIPDAAPDSPLGDPDIVSPLVFEDEWLMVFDKPAGLVTHPAPGNATGTLVNAVIGKYPDFAAAFPDGEQRPGIVHRLDKDTSGLVLVAKTPEAAAALVAAFAARQISKTYLAITAGVPSPAAGTITGNIGRHPVARKKMAVLANGGKAAETSYQVLRVGSVDGHPLAIASLKPLTGRTHQIRVHLAHIGTPVLGDAVYGARRRPWAPRQMLHAWKIDFKHPIHHQTVRFEAPVPEDMREFDQCWISER